MKYTLVAFIMTLMGPALGQAPLIEGKNQKFIHHDETLGLFLIEPLKPGMTLYGLSQRYNVTIEQIRTINPGIDPATVPLGYPVNIPVAQKAISFEIPSDEAPVLWLSYRVAPKETLYRISKVYLGVAPEELIRLNPGSSQGIQIGQVLHVGWLLNCPLTDHPADMTLDSALVVPIDFIKVADAEGQKIHEQKGLAVWKPGSPTSNYYVLHPTAKVGTFMEITNPMLHKTITAKVAGHIPPGLYQNHVGIVVSSSTARALGVLDQQFYAYWRYVE